MLEKQEKTQWDALRVVKELEDIARLAKNDGQFSAAVNAIKTIIDVNGIEAPKSLNLNHKTENIDDKTLANKIALVLQSAVKK